MKFYVVSSNCKNFFLPFGNDVLVRTSSNKGPTIWVASFGACWKVKDSIRKMVDGGAATPPAELVQRCSLKDKKEEIETVSQEIIRYNLLFGCERNNRMMECVMTSHMVPLKLEQAKARTTFSSCHKNDRNWNRTYRNDLEHVHNNRIKQYSREYGSEITSKMIQSRTKLLPWIFLLLIV